MGEVDLLLLGYCNRGRGKSRSRLHQLEDYRRGMSFSAGGGGIKKNRRRPIQFLFLITRAKHSIYAKGIAIFGMDIA